MDQVKIGKFIAEERKAKGYTQRQLADRLSISDKTVSKWERGNGFPEVSLLLPLCSELSITVNELLAGERVSEQDYRKKAEENMMDMMEEREVNRKRLRSTTLTGVIAIVSFVTILMTVCLYASAMTLPARIILLAIAGAIFVTGLYTVMQGGRTIGYYKCRHCGEKFTPDFGPYSVSPHMIWHRYLKCPHCGKSSWCRKVFSRDE